MSSHDDTIARVTHALALTKALAEAGLSDEMQHRIIAEPQIASLAVSFLETSASTLVSLRGPDEPTGNSLAQDFLSSLTYNTLSRKLGGFVRLIEVTVLSEVDLQRTMQFGPKSLKELKMVLQRAGLKLRQDDEEFWEKAKAVFGGYDMLTPMYLFEHVVPGGGLWDGSVPNHSSKLGKLLNKTPTIGELAMYSKAELEKNDLTEDNIRRLDRVLNHFDLLPEPRQ